jgi:hypothetical protein
LALVIEVSSVLARYIAGLCQARQPSSRMASPVRPSMRVLWR